MSLALPLTTNWNSPCACARPVRSSVTSTPGYATVCVEYVLVNRPFTTMVAVTKWPWPSSATSTVIVAVWPS